MSSKRQFIWLKKNEMLWCSAFVAKVFWKVSLPMSFPSQPLLASAKSIFFLFNLYSKKNLANYLIKRTECVLMLSDGFRRAHLKEWLQRAHKWIFGDDQLQLTTVFCILFGAHLKIVAHLKWWLWHATDVKMTNRIEIHSLFLGSANETISHFWGNLKCLYFILCVVCIKHFVWKEMLRLHRTYTERDIFDR